ncbi:hypothetical protein A7Q09_08930 [Methylacidiphilum sp. Yel]|jgi:predicted site-specific integrase-resolvase|uniref:recombinase family protein n=1 Tax=Methylacidiphilum sp. Yel TaxID=1847730 RepID=UPI00106C9C84|nr:hypothetical protein A7Q09_08930 [Methylacidiphilum sp. Yel]
MNAQLGGQCRSDLAQFRPDPFYALKAVGRTIAYARVFSFEQKDELEQQKQLLERYCAWQGWTFEVIANQTQSLFE